MDFSDEIKKKIIKTVSLKAEQPVVIQFYHPFYSYWINIKKIFLIIINSIIIKLNIKLNLL